MVEPFRGLAHLREGRVVLPELVPALHLSGEGCDELPGDPIPQRSVSPAGRGDALAEPFVDGGLLGLRGVLRDELLRLGLLLEADLGPGASVGDGDRVWARLLVLEGPFLERFARAVHLRGAAVVGGDSVHDHMDVEVIAIVVADDVGLPVLEPEGFEGAVYSPLDLVLGRAVVVLPREGVVKHRVRQLPARRLDASQLLEGHGARDGGGHHPGRVVGGTGCEVRPGVEVDGHSEGHAVLGLRVTGVVGDVLQHPQEAPAGAADVGDHGSNRARTSASARATSSRMDRNSAGSRSPWCIRLTAWLRFDPTPLSSRSNLASGVARAAVGQAGGRSRRAATASCRRRVDGRVRRADAAALMSTHSVEVKRSAARSDNRSSAALAGLAMGCVLPTVVGGRLLVPGNRFWVFACKTPGSYLALTVLV